MGEGVGKWMDMERVRRKRVKKGYEPLCLGDVWLSDLYLHWTSSYMPDATPKIPEDHLPFLVIVVPKFSPHSRLDEEIYVVLTESNWNCYFCVENYILLNIENIEKRDFFFYNLKGTISNFTKLQYLNVSRVGGNIYEYILIIVQITCH